MTAQDVLLTLAVGAVTGTVGSVITAKVMLAVLVERLNNTVSRLDRMERLLERLVTPIGGTQQ